LDPGVHVSLRTYGLANQCNAAVVDALSITIIEATAPLAITDKSGDVKKVTSGPPAHTNQVSKKVHANVEIKIKWKYKCSETLIEKIWWCIRKSSESPAWVHTPLHNIKE
jgi:hypothetical protein